MAGFVQIMQDFWQDFLQDFLQDLQNSRKLGFFNFLNAGFWQDLSTIMQDFFRPILRLKTYSSQG